MGKRRWGVRRKIGFFVVSLLLVLAALFVLDWRDRRRTVHLKIDALGGGFLNLEPYESVENVVCTIFIDDKFADHPWALISEISSTSLAIHFSWGDHHFVSESPLMHLNRLSGAAKNSMSFLAEALNVRAAPGETEISGRIYGEKGAALLFPKTDTPCLRTGFEMHAYLSPSSELKVESLDLHLVRRRQILW